MSLIRLTSLLLITALQVAPQGLLVRGSGGGGAAIERQYYSAATEAEASTSSSTYSDAETLTFTPDASATYAIIASWEAQPWHGGFGYYRLHHDTPAAAIHTFYHRRTSTGSSEWSADGAIDIYTAPGSPASQTWSIEFADHFNFQTEKIRARRMLALRLESDDESSELGSAFTTSTDHTVYQTAHSLTFSPASTGDYLIIVSGQLGIAGTGYPFAQLDVAGSTSHTDTFIKDRASTPNEQYVLWFARVANLTTGSKTINVDIKSSDSTAVSLDTCAILALRLDGFEESYYVQDLTDDTNTTTTFATRVTDTNTLTASQDYVLIGGSTAHAPSGDSHEERLTHDSVVIHQSYYDPNVSETPSEHALNAYMFLDAAVGGGSVTSLEEFRKAGVETVTSDVSLIALLRM